MGFLNNWLNGFEEVEEVEERALPQQQSNIEDLQYYATANVNTTKIPPRYAMQIPAVAGAVEKIVDLLIQLDVRLLDSDGKEVEDDRLQLLNNDTGDLLDIIAFRKAMYMDALIYGDSHAYIKKQGNVPVALVYVPRERIVVDNSRCLLNPIENVRDVRILVDGKDYDSFEFVNIVFGKTDDGVSGQSIIDYLSETLGTASLVDRHSNKNLSNNGLKKGVIQAKNKVDKGIMQGLKQAWKKLWSNDDETLIVLSQGLEYRELQSSAVELQLEQIKQRTDEEILNALGVSLQILEDKASLEQYNAWLSGKIGCYISLIESAYNKNLLLETEKGSLHFEINLDKLLRTDIEKRFRAYETAVKNGFKSRNEIREEEGYEPVDGLDTFVLSLGNVLYDPNTGEYIIPNMAKKLPSGEEE